MSLAAPYQEHYYVADGVTTSFAFGEDFTALSAANVKCVIYFEDGTNCVPTFTVDMTTGFITIVTLTKPDGTVLTVPPAGSIVRVFRDTPEQQNVTASQLQNYTAKQLERIFDSVVAMIQEVSYSDLHKTIRLTETQRDVSMEQLKEENDQAILYWDFETRQLKATDYGQNQVVKSDTVDRLVYLQPEGKIYFIPKGSNNPIAIGSATIHNDLGGRNAPDCHPESAITNLTTHLQELRDADAALAENVQTALNRSQEAKDTADAAKGTAEYAQTVAEDAKDIAEDAKDIAEGIEDIAEEAKDTADDAKDIAQDAKDIAEGIEDIAQDALDKVTQEITDREDADEDLQDQIDSLSGRGRFLALWNCATGLAESNPPESPYLYKAGDYFVVGTVSSANPAVNYKPDGSSYTTGVASTTVETNEVSVNDTYFYDGTVWKLQSNAQKEVSFSALAGSPYDNTALGNALNDKVSETTTASQVYGTDNNGDQTTYNTTDFGAVDDVKVNNVSVVTSKIANIDLTSYLKNTATATDAITVLGTSNTTWTNGINIGKDSRINSTNGIAIGVDASADVNAVGVGRDADAGVRGTAIGAYAKTSYDTGIAIGCWNSNVNNAVSSAKGAYQFGVGTNSTARTLNVGWYDDSVSPSTFRNYQLLDGGTGLIPDARISTNITRTADLATVATTGDYDDLLNKPTIPTVNDATLTIQKNGTNVATFTANASSNVTANISVPTTAADIGAFGANDIVQNLNSFTTKPKMYFSTTDNVLFSANRRFTVAGSGFDSFNGAKLFDGSYEDYNQCQVALGGTGTITITGSSITGVYRQGYMLISFYSGRGPANLSDVTVTIENANGNIATPELSWESSNKLVIRATVATLGTGNAISKITISVANNRTSGTVDVVEVEYFVSRPSSINLLPVVVKNANNVIYGSLTADSLIKSGGTSAQFLKADGSTDSNTYATTAQLPTVNDATITITQGGVTKGSFTLNQSSGDTIALDAGGGSSYTAGDGIDITSDVISVSDLDCGTM